MLTSRRGLLEGPCTKRNPFDYPSGRLDRVNAHPPVYADAVSQREVHFLVDFDLPSYRPG
jgi:hypothetical protein